MKKSLSMFLVAMAVVIGFAGCGSKKVATVSVGVAPADISADYYFADNSYEGSSVAPDKIMFSTDITVKNFQFISVGYGEDENSNISYYKKETLTSLDELTPEKPFVTDWLEQGLMPQKGISYVDNNGVTRNFYITMSGEDGTLMLTEF